MTETVDDLIEACLSNLPKQKALHEFASVYLKSISYRSLSALTPKDWADFIKLRFDFVKPHLTTPGVYFRFGSSNSSQSINTFESVCLDAPFLLLTIESLFREFDINVTRMYHPVMAIESSKSSIKSIRKASVTSNRLSVIYIQFDDLDDKKVQKKLESTLELHLNAVLSSDRDHNAIIKTLVDVKEDIAKHDVPLDEPQSEWANLVDWLRNENFSFMGYIRYETKKNPKRTDHECIKKSGLGILSPDMHPHFEYLHKIMSAHSWKMRTYPSYHMFDRLSANSPIQRFENLMRLCIRFQKKDNTIVEHTYIGILRQSSLLSKNLDTPIIHLKMQSIFKARHMLPGSYDYNEVIRIFTSIPKYDLFRRSANSLMLMVDDLLSITNPNEIYCFTRPKSDTRLPLLVVIPYRHFSHANIEKISEYLTTQIPHSEFEAIEIPSDEHPRVQYYFEQNDPEPYLPDCSALEADIRELIKTWDEQFQDNISVEYPGPVGKRLTTYYQSAFPEHYRVRRTPSDAVRDVKTLERLLHEERIQFNLLPFTFKESLISGKASLLIIYHKEKIELIDIMPILENMGFHVFDELTTRIGQPPNIHGYMHNFRLADRQQNKIDEDKYRDKLLELLENVFTKRTANDSLNQLCLLAELDWRAINVMQLYRNLLFQVTDFTRKKITATLLTHPKLTRLLFDYFETKFSINTEFGDRSYREKQLLPKLEREFLDMLQDVEEVAEDLIFRRLLNLIQSTLRTNFYVGESPAGTAISIKLDSSKVSQLPLPVPYREVYVHDIGMEGCHLRFGAVARGGLRWSNRPDDFRKEVLGLVKTQQSKNVVIVPVGSKGGFIVKHTPLDKKEAFDGAVFQYRRFISALLDITDNFSDSGQLKHPSQVIFYDDPDPYLVVAADKGTAMFSDYANEVSSQYGFWLGDAFASGGSAGYNHKEVGITAKGAWEKCAKLHFREMGVDIQNEDFTVAGIGDMSGDVFGNGMLLSEHICLKAAFNHMHIFLDPSPNAKKSWIERKRLFDTPGSTWADYKKTLISKGGGIFNRKAKEIELSQEIRAMLGTKQKTMTGEELISAVLKMKVDLLWFGGIGTYIKSKHETNLSVNDPANDAVRVNCQDVQAKVIGEGANLGLTQSARIELSKDRGARLNTDAIDNSAGVNMSDYEVNIKIFLNTLVRRKVLRSMNARNKLLEEMTDAVAALCLRNNRRQHRLISIDQLRSVAHGTTFIRMIQTLEKRGMVDLKHDGIPEILEIEEMVDRRKPIPRPALAVLQAVIKMWVYDDLLDSGLSDNEALAPFYTSYFPEILLKKYGKHLSEHHLRKEILYTSLCNKMVNQTGLTFFYQMQELTGATIGQITLAYLVVDSSLGGDDIRKQIFTTDRVSEADRYAALIALEDVLESLTRDLLQLDDIAFTMDTVQRFSDVFQKLRQSFTDRKGSYRTSLSEWKSRGFDDETSDALGFASHLYGSVDVLYLHLEKGLPIPDILSAMRVIDQTFDLDWVRKRLSNSASHSHWDVSQKDILFQHLRFQKLRIFDLIQAKLGKQSLETLDQAELKEILKPKYGSLIELYSTTLQRLRGVSKVDLTSLTVAINRLKF